MSKDPAFLFYPQSFAHGTRFMTFEQKGAYIELLCEQADTGHLSTNTIKLLLNSHYHLWDVVKIKFIQDENGLYYNKILEEHIIRRQNYVESRKHTVRSPYDKRTINRNVNVNKDNVVVSSTNIINNKIVKNSNMIIPPEISAVKAYCQERKNGVNADKWFNFYEAKGWMIGKNKMKDWRAAVRTWEGPGRKGAGEYKPPVHEEISEEGRAKISELCKNAIKSIK